MDRLFSLEIDRELRIFMHLCGANIKFKDVRTYTCIILYEKMYEMFKVKLTISNDAFKLILIMLLFIRIVNF